MSTTMRTQAKTILIAEDDEFLVTLLKLHLQKREGITVNTAKDGKETIAKLKDQPDLLLLDLLMPGTDGFAVLEHMRTHDIHVPVLVISNLSQKSDKEKCKELGTEAYFVKSAMDLNRLVDTVHSKLQ